MKLRLIAAAWLAALAMPAGAQDSGQPDLTGSWERYPQPGETAEPRYARIEVPPPPLKQPWLAQWQENEAKLAARLTESQPAGDNYVKCLPDGMPAMMQGMFPMEIFQRPEQIRCRAGMRSIRLSSAARSGAGKATRWSSRRPGSRNTSSSAGRRIRRG